MRSELAKQYFLQGFNCAQAVALAFAEESGAPKELLARATIGLGAGMGRLREVCGAVSGAAVSLGLLFPERPKSEIYTLVQELAGEFARRNGSYLCGELLQGAGVQAGRDPNAEARTSAYYKKRPCAELVGDAADILETIVARERAK